MFFSGIFFNFLFVLIVVRFGKMDEDGEMARRARRNYNSVGPVQKR